MKNIAVVCLVACLLAGCGTFGFLRSSKGGDAGVPVDALKAVASEIEMAVAAGQRDLNLADRDGVKINSPEIAQALRTRAVRHELVSNLMDTGFAWERPNGRIAILRSSAYKKATTSQERDRNALLIMNENQNRWTLYEGLIALNHWPSKALPVIERAFSESCKASLKSGQKFENESGKPQAK